MAGRAREVLRDELVDFWTERAKEAFGSTPWKNSVLAELARFLVWVRARSYEHTQGEIAKEEINILLQRLVSRLDTWVAVFDQAAATLAIRVDAPENPVRPTGSYKGLTSSRASPRSPPAGASWPSEDEAEEAARARYARRGWGR